MRQHEASQLMRCFFCFCFKKYRKTKQFSGLKRLKRRLHSRRTVDLINFQYVIDSLETEEQRMTAEMIFENYKNMMYHTAYDVLRHREDAEDAVTAAMIKLCRNMDLVFSVKPERVPRLVYTTVRNTAIDFYRSRQLRKTVSLDEAGIDPADDEDLFGDVEDFGVLQKYVDALAEKYKTILLLRYVDGLKNREIARLLGIPEGTVSTRMDRARRQLRDMYRKEAEQNG
ncbi:MAG: sigma-70 family RNA polymerase sigma factor [Clostridia bacterium]|nr:sigma-70 family RNA polymerase sigma factor [Clostridia bacterium]